MPTNEAIAAIKSLYDAGIKALITCESGPDATPKVIAQFRNLQDAHAFYDALIQCGKAARTINDETQR